MPVLRPTTLVKRRTPFGCTISLVKHLTNLDGRLEKTLIMDPKTHVDGGPNEQHVPHGPINFICVV